MATTLIDTRKPIMDQIHASWNQFRTTDEAVEVMPMDGRFTWGRNTDMIPTAKDFPEKDAPWSSKQTVLERNAVHANKLIRLYISLNIEMAARMRVWEFFEISAGVVGKIKEKIKLLKRVTRVLKKQQQYGMDLSNATDLYLWQKSFQSKIMQRQRFKRYIEAKKRQARKDSEKKKREEKKVVAWIEATKHSKRDMLKMWKAMERDGYTIRDVIEELERQLD